MRLAGVTSRHGPSRRRRRPARSRPGTILTPCRTAYAAQLTQWRELYDRARPFLRDLEPMAFAHAMMRLDAEISSHGEVIAELLKLRNRSGTDEASGPD